MTTSYFVVVLVFIISFWTGFNSFSLGSIVRLNYFLLLFLRAASNQLGLKVGP